MLYAPKFYYMYKIWRTMIVICIIYLYKFLNVLIPYSNFPWDYAKI